MKEKLYQSIIAGLLIFIIVFFSVENKLYFDLLEQNEELHNLLDESLVQQELLNDMWESRYNVLEEKYIQLLIEYDKINE